MRIALIGFVVLTIVLPAGIEMAAAQSPPKPWCLQSGRGGPGGGLPDCTYYTLQQCLASIGGGADGCFPEPGAGVGPDRGQALRAAAAEQGARQRLLRRALRRAVDLAAEPFDPRDRDQQHQRDHRADDDHVPARRDRRRCRARP